MIKVEYVKNLESMMEMLLEQKYDENTQRYRSSYIYRGLSSAGYELKTSLERNCKENAYVLEPSILRNFAKYAAIEIPELMDSNWNQLIMGQHRGLPTRLLDWTHSALIGLHFATTASCVEDIDKEDGVVWKIDVREIKSLLPINYQKKLEENSASFFTVDMLDDIAKNLEQYDKDMKDKSIVLLEPPSIDERIINQYSYFTVVPKDITSIEDFLNKNTKNTIKYIIDKDLKWRIRDFLDQMNINERILFPGLDGLSLWLKRYYFVK